VSSNPEVTVAAVVEREGRFLVVEERISGRLVLNQPAGHLEAGETLVEAAVREAREETAWRFTPAAMIGTYLWRNPDNGRSYLRFAFSGSVDDHRPQQSLDTGIVRALWLTHDQLLAQPHRLRSPLVLRCIDDYLLGKSQPLDAVACLGLDTVIEAQAGKLAAVVSR
jgi:8-oxo-dGTP pyrophosphatase MutT (NUDIX family)